ncbi:MAG: exodeoxyribonuclease VII large subunit [Campylobacterales bacterium]|nr:exodeoxyribonuclease VII large subunit [Campylobacterales bacterium]
MSLTVTQLNNQIKSLLETTFDRVSVRGEISRITHHSSGHVYFDIKDGSSSLSCVMFRGNAAKLKFRLEQGQDIILDAVVTVYIPRGNYQLNCFSATPAGEGALSLAYEQLKKKLEAKGYFDPSRKKPLPKFPKSIGIVTSKTGAALQDILNVINKRWTLTKITLYNSLVQGEGAGQSIAQKISSADKKNHDVIIIGRGGGSIEDLWCFNEEVVADAIYDARTPIVSAVGHEIDYVISDFVADLRSPTPSAAIENILPDRYEFLQYIDSISDRVQSNFSQILHRKTQTLEHIKKSFLYNSPKNKILKMEEEVKILERRLKDSISYLVRSKESQILPLKDSLTRERNLIFTKKEYEVNNLIKQFTLADPTNKIQEGFGQIVKDGKNISIEDLKKGDEFEVIGKNKKINSKAIQITTF